MLTRPRFRRFFIGSLDLKGELFVESSGIWVKANERNIHYVNMYLQCRVIAYLLKYDCPHVLKRESATSKQSRRFTTTAADFVHAPHAVRGDVPGG
tara:strand:+ start:475 stop:762 length:288 start_codon:yes stop_codon:yes gene_type:complete